MTQANESVETRLARLETAVANLVETLNEKLAPPPWGAMMGAVAVLVSIATGVMTFYTSTVQRDLSNLNEQFQSDEHRHDLRLRDLERMAAANLANLEMRGRWMDNMQDDVRRLQNRLDGGLVEQGRRGGVIDRLEQQVNAIDSGGSRAWVGRDKEPVEYE